jgi:hypothetical protein
MQGPNATNQKSCVAPSRFGRCSVRHNAAAPPLTPPKERDWRVGEDCLEPRPTLLRSSNRTWAGGLVAGQAPHAEFPEDVAPGKDEIM